MEEAIYGLGMIEELRRHGYQIGPGTLYPILHRLTARGYLRKSPGRGRQKCYQATDKGRRAVNGAYHFVAELFGELRRPDDVA